MEVADLCGTSFLFTYDYINGYLHLFITMKIINKPFSPIFKLAITNEIQNPKVMGIKKGFSDYYGKTNLFLKICKHRTKPQNIFHYLSKSNLRKSCFSNKQHPTYLLIRITNCLLKLKKLICCLIRTFPNHTKVNLAFRFCT